MTRMCSSCGSPHSQLGRRCPSCAALPLSTAKAAALLGLLTVGGVSPALADDPQTVAEPAPPPSAIYGPPPSFDPGPLPQDGPLTIEQLEMKAMLGQLTPGQIRDLEVVLREDGDLADKANISRLLMANAWAAGDQESWEKHVKLHLGTIDQTDPDLSYKYSLFLSKQDPMQGEEVIRWADVALEHRQKWEGATYTSRVYSLHKLRSNAAKALWSQAAELGLSDQVGPARERTKNMALEWSAMALEAGKDPSDADELCVVAAASMKACGLPRE